MPRLASQDAADKLELLKATDDFSGRIVGKSNCHQTLGPAKYGCSVAMRRLCSALLASMFAYEVWPHAKGRTTFQNTVLVVDDDACHQLKGFAIAGQFVNELRAEQATCGSVGESL